jgi:hypothetical protein
MYDAATEIDHVEQDILIHEFPDESLEAAAGLQGGIKVAFDLA